MKNLKQLAKDHPYPKLSSGWKAKRWTAMTKAERADFWKAVAYSDETGDCSHYLTSRRPEYRAWFSEVATFEVMPITWNGDDYVMIVPSYDGPYPKDYQMPAIRAYCQPIILTNIDLECQWIPSQRVRR